MSPPAMKCAPAPRSTMQRRLSSAASCVVCATNASLMVRSSVLSDDGRFSVRVAIGPSRSTSTESWIRSVMNYLRRRRGVGTRAGECRLLERTCRFQLVHRPGDITALLADERIDGTREIRIRDGVQRTCRHRQETACQFVGTLRAAFKKLDTPLYAELDGLVVARLKMKPRNVRQCSPVTAPKRAASVKIQCRANRLAAEPPHHQKHAVGQFGSQAQKEFQRKIRR